MNVAIFGAGYVGCVTAASLASLGNKVWLVESADSKLSVLQQAQSPIIEPGIDPLLPDFIRGKQITPLSDPHPAIEASDLAFICVGTPSLPDGTTDIRQVQSVFRQIIQSLKNRRTAYTLVLRSTVPYPLLEKHLLAPLQTELPGRYGKDISFAFHPEFLREGSAMQDFMNPPFLIIGSEHPAAADQLRLLYKKLSAPVHVMSVGSASLLKYACNAFHALKISFANEIASLSAIFQADAGATLDVFCQDKTLNISPAYLKPGFAYGGSCLPKDLKTLNRISSAEAVAVPVLEAIEKSNGLLIEKTVHALADFGAKRIGLIGLTFKAGTDDFRNSPWVEIAERLLGKGIELSVYDPDIDMRKIHGQNLRYIEQRLRHLAQHLTPDFKTLVSRSDLLVVGKPLASLAAEWAQVPADRLILDLTRRMPERSEKPRVLHLETLLKISAERSAVSS